MARPGALVHIDQSAQRSPVALSGRVRETGYVSAPFDLTQAAPIVIGGTCGILLRGKWYLLSDQVVFPLHLCVYYVPCSGRKEGWVRQRSKSWPGGSSD